MSDFMKWFLGGFIKMMAELIGLAWLACGLLYGAPITIWLSNLPAWLCAMVTISYVIPCTFWVIESANKGEY